MDLRTAGRGEQPEVTPLPRGRALAEMIEAHPWRVTLVVVSFLGATLGIVGYISIHVGPREPFAGDWSQLVYSGPLSGLISYWQRWDALWYQHIAESGYSARDGSTAFFPLYPLLSRATSALLLGNVVLGELAVSALSLVVATGLLWQLVGREAIGDEGDRWNLPYPVDAARKSELQSTTVLLVLLFPAGFFLFAPYTESLFLVFAVASLLCARSGRPWLAGLAGLLASLTRVQGVFLALPLAYEYLRRQQTWDWFRLRGGRPPGLAAIAAALPLGGLLLFTAYQRLVLAAPGVGLDSVTGWGYRVTMPWDALAASLGYLTGGGHNLNAQAVEAFNLLCLLSALAITAIGARRMPLALTLYVIPSIGLLFFRQMYFSPLMSVSRYVLAAFPCFMVLASWLAPHRKTAVLVLAVSVVLELLLFQYWTRWGFVA